MVLTPSTMLPLGTKAPDFSLPDPNGKTVSLADFAGKPALLVVFMCNHCPYVKHVADGLAQLAKDYQARGAAVVGISSNDVEEPPRRFARQDGRRGQATRLHIPVPVRPVARRGQGLPRRLHAGFLRLRPRIISSPIAARWTPAGPIAGIPVTGKDLRAALDAVLAGKAPSADQKPEHWLQYQMDPQQRPGLFQVGRLGRSVGLESPFVMCSGVLFGLDLALNRRAEPPSPHQVVQAEGQKQAATNDHGRTDHP